MEMWDKIKALLNSQKGATTLGFSTISGSLIIGIFYIIVAPILGAEDFGIVSYFYAIAGLTFAISSWGARHVLLVYLSKGIKIFSTFSFVTLLSSLIAAIVIFILYKEISIFILIIGLVIFELALHELLAKQLYSKHMKYLLAQKFIFVIFSLPLYFILGPPGFILGIGISMFPGLIRIYQGFKESKIDFNLIKNRLNFIFQNYFLHLSRVSYTFVDRLIVFPLFGSITLGNYELSMQIIILANVFSIFLYQYLIPKDARNESTRKFKLFAIAISSILSLMVIFFSPIIFPMIFPRYLEAVEFLPILGISIIPHVMIILHMSKFLASEQTRPVLTGSLLHLGVLVSAIFVLSNFYSAMGVAIAFVLAEIVESIFLIIMYKKTFKCYL